MSDNTKLWDAVFQTDPSATKSFTKGGGFRGTAVKPMWLIWRATQQWGPMGGRWGIRVISQEVLEGAPIIGQGGELQGHERVHTVLIELWHPGPNDERWTVPSFGQTMLVSRRKDGPYTDEDAPKKSLTDALSKALSWLGFGGDIHMGLFDSNKYVPAQPPPQARTAGQLAESLLKAAETGMHPLENCFKQNLNAAERAMLSREQLEEFKKIARAHDASSSR